MKIRAPPFGGGDQRDDRADDSDCEKDRTPQPGSVPLEIFDGKNITVFVR